MSGSNYCFLTCIQVTQEAGKVVGYSHLLKNFPLFIVTHTVKGFSIVYEAEVDVLLDFSSFFYDPANVNNLISVSSDFSKSIYTCILPVSILIFIYLFTPILLYLSPSTFLENQASCLHFKQGDSAQYLFCLLLFTCFY